MQGMHIKKDSAKDLKISYFRSI